MKEPGPYPNPTSMAGKILDSTIDELRARFGEPLPSGPKSVPSGARHLIADRLFGVVRWEVPHVGVVGVRIPPLHKKPVALHVVLQRGTGRSTRSILGLFGFPVPSGQSPTLISGAVDAREGLAINYLPLAPHLSELTFRINRDAVSAWVERPPGDELSKAIEEYRRQFDFEGTMVCAGLEAFMQGSLKGTLYPPDHVHIRQLVRQAF